jgi:hypothetical protein
MHHVVNELAFDLGQKQRWIAQNTRKMQWQNRVVQAATDGELLCFLDCDMLVLRDVSELSKLLGGREIGITVCSAGSKYFFNSGTVLVRVSGSTKALYELWACRAAELQANINEYNRWQPRYGGVSQSAFGSIMDNNEFDSAKICLLPCLKWNATAIDHLYALEHSHIVHCLGKLKLLFGATTYRGKHVLAPLLNKWKSYE